MNSRILADLPKDELWRIACQLNTEVEVLRTENQELRQQLAQVQARVQQLQAELALPKKTSSNSSKPPSASHKAQQKKGVGKSRGGKPGHPGISRSVQEPGLVIECRAEVCQACGASLSGLEGECIGSH